jgi:hypothetical protein
MDKKYKMVPVEPTEEMHIAARDWSYAKYGKPIGKEASEACYKVMLDAAPEQSCQDCNHKIAYQEWSDKTEFIQERLNAGKMPVKYLGWHRADIMRDLIDNPLAFLGLEPKQLEVGERYIFKAKVHKDTNQAILMRRSSLTKEQPPATEPTDDEIRKVAEKHYGTCMTSQELSFARAILTEFSQRTPAEPNVGHASASPTAGMNLGQRIAHVGGRTNEHGYVEFGSEMAVDALILQVLRDMKPDREAIRNAAIEESANTAFNAPITADMLDSDDAKAVALHAASRIRTLKSQPAQPANEEKWRDLALQFDEHRMQAMGWLQVCAEKLPERSAEVIKEFLKAPPLSGQKVLAERIASMSQSTQQNDREALAKVDAMLVAALALPAKPLPDPFAHSHEAYGRALHAVFCDIRFKMMHAREAIAAVIPARKE